MTPYGCFQFWMAAKTHLTEMNYDIVKYQGKTKHADVDAFESSPQRAQYVRLSNHYAPKWMMLATLLDNESAWIGDAKGERAEELCAERMGKVEALTYTFRQDIAKLPKDIASLIRYEKGRHPLLMQRYLGKRISLETMTILGAITNFPRMWIADGGHDVMVERIGRVCVKYASFLPIDHGKFRRLLVEEIKNRD